MGLAYNNYFGINATLSAMEYVLTIWKAQTNELAFVLQIMIVRWL